MTFLSIRRVFFSHIFNCPYVTTLLLCSFMKILPKFIIAFQKLTIQHLLVPKVLIGNGQGKTSFLGTISDLIVFNPPLLCETILLYHKLGLHPSTKHITKWECIEILGCLLLL